MTLNEFVDCFAAELDETPKELFNAETVYRDLDEWDSLAVLSIISMIDEEFEKTVTGANLREHATIKELYNFLQ